MRSLDGITHSMDMSLSNLWESVMDISLACCSPWGLQRVKHDGAPKLNWTDHNCTAGDRELIQRI